MSAKREHYRPPNELGAYRIGCVDSEGTIEGAPSPEEALERGARRSGYASHADEESDAGCSIVAVRMQCESVSSFLSLLDAEDADPKEARRLAAAFGIGAWDDATPAAIVTVRIDGVVHRLCETRYADPVRMAGVPYWTDLDTYENPFDAGEPGRGETAIALAELICDLDDDGFPLPADIDDELTAYRRAVGRKRRAPPGRVGRVGKP